ncbi:hypothetical protein GCM10009554_01740 [Kribbella koreensis]|uniref:Uncharacterized protein n=2 Tax=Kribbella koreensis TaxID=57909 RepID=A0ABN1P6G3_9ACTN
MEHEQVADPQVFSQVGDFDEVPIYSRYSQLGFLDGLSFAEKNRELILAAVRQMDRIHQHFGGPVPAGSTILRMVAVSSWAVEDEQSWQWRCGDGTTEFVAPYLWLCDLSHPNLANFRVHRPRSRQAAIVAEVVDSARYQVFEDRPPEYMPDCPVRVYVTRTEQLPLLPIAED